MAADWLEYWTKLVRLMDASSPRRYKSEKRRLSDCCGVRLVYVCPCLWCESLLCEIPSSSGIKWKVYFPLGHIEQTREILRYFSSFEI